MTQLDHFETALLEELRDSIVTRTTPSTTPGRAARRRPSARRLTAVVVGATATAVLGAVVLSDRAPAAYAVSRQPNGDIRVTVNRLDDAPGLQRQLARVGVHAVVRFWHHGPSTPFSNVGSGRVFDPAQLPAGNIDYAARHCTGTTRPTLTPSGDQVTITLPQSTVRTAENLTIYTAGADISHASVAVAEGNRTSGCANVVGHSRGTADAYIVWGQDEVGRLSEGR